MNERQILQRQGKPCICFIFDLKRLRLLLSRYGAILVIAFSLFAIVLQRFLRWLLKVSLLSIVTPKIAYSSAEGILVLTSRNKSLLSGLELKLI